MFTLDEKFTEDQIKEFCKICNTHWDDCFNSINALALELILNNCRPDMFRKITVQLEGVSEDQRGGALALFYIRRAVVRASQENSETIKTALKNLKIKDLTAENVDDAVRIIRNAHATLKAAKSVPTKFYLQLFDTMQGKDCIKILPIPTQDQQADIFTKALTKALFATFRKLLMGW